MLSARSHFSLPSHKHSGPTNTKDKGFPFIFRILGWQQAFLHEKGLHPGAPPGIHLLRTYFTHQKDKGEPFIFCQNIKSSTFSPENVKNFIGLSKINVMERKVPFEVGEYYHLFTRGVEKREVFLATGEYERFQLLLGLCNGAEPVHLANFFKKYKGEPFISLIQQGVGDGPGPDALVELIAYALMPNHVHLLVRERAQGGISRFMLKLMTAYSAFFNAKHQRSGPLFTRPFRSRHVDDDEYLRWVYAYVTLNPLDLYQRDWREKGIDDLHASADFIRGYRFSNFPDHFSGARPESVLLENDRALPLGDLHDMDALLNTLATDEDLYVTKFA